jgi:hypothetical protein
VTSSAKTRTPQYVPASTRSVAILVLEVGGSPVADTASVTNVSPGTSPCSTVSGTGGNANYTCTISVQLPIGTDTTQIATYDATGATGNLLSEQLVSAAVLEGHSNTFSATLDANPGTIGLTAGTNVTGASSPYVLSGSGNATFTLSLVDAHGTAFGSPTTQLGQPAFDDTGAATGTGASATISGTTLTVTPPTSGATSVVVNADPAGTVTSTTLTSSPAASATSFTVASTTKIFPGVNLVLDYETFSGTTLLQESVHVTNVSGSTITISTGLVHAHASGHAVRLYSDNLTPSDVNFAVDPPSYIAPVGTEYPGSEAFAYSDSFVAQTGSVTSGSATYDAARFDGSDILYLLDSPLNEIYEKQYTAGSGFTNVATVTGLTTQQGTNYAPFSANIAFDVSHSGNVAVVDSAGSMYQLQTFLSGQSSAALNFTSSTLTLGNGWQTVQPYLNGAVPTVAVLDDASETVFGYAYAVGTIYNTGSSSCNTTADRIVVVNTNGSSEQDLTNGDIISQYCNDSTPAVLTWDNGRQSLIYGNSHPNGGGTYPLYEFPRVGTTGANLNSTTSAPTESIGTVTGAPIFVAASRDGQYVAVAYESTNISVRIFHNSGTSWAVASSGSALETGPDGGGGFSQFTSMHFLTNGNLVVTDSTAGAGDLYQYTNVGASSGVGPLNLFGPFGGAYTVTDVAISY